MFYVDGLPQGTMDQAEIVATRLFKRYDGFRTITIVNEDGVVVHTMEATKEIESIDDTIDWIESLPIE
jgi:hypothetical protein